MAVTVEVAVAEAVLVAVVVAVAVAVAVLVAVGGAVTVGVDSGVIVGVGTVAAATTYGFLYPAVRTLKLCVPKKIVRRLKFA